jgi:hypothetical protein
VLGATCSNFGAVLGQSFPATFPSASSWCVSLDAPTGNSYPLAIGIDAVAPAVVAVAVGAVRVSVWFG